MKSLVYYLIYLNVIVSTSVGILTAGISDFLNNKDSILFGVFGFLSTFIIYNGQRLFKTKSIITPWVDWVKRKSLIILILISFASAALIIVLYFLKFSKLQYLALLISGLISVFYIIKIGSKNLRSIPGLKIHLISIVWSIVLVIIPSLDQGNHNTLLAVAIYFYILGVTIPFDIRDLKFDSKEQKTIPQLVGVNISKIIASISILVAGTIFIYFEIDFLTNWGFYLALLIQLALILLMSEKRGDLYCAGLIDGSIAFLGISFFLV